MNRIFQRLLKSFMVIPPDTYEKGGSITKKVFLNDVKGIAERITALPSYYRSFTIVMRDQAKPKTCRNE
jgi:hypothetical protein